MVSENGQKCTVYIVCTTERRFMKVKTCSRGVFCSSPFYKSSTFRYNQDELVTVPIMCGTMCVSAVCFIILVSMDFKECLVSLTKLT